MASVLFLNKGNVCILTVSQVRFIVLCLTLSDVYLSVVVRGNYLFTSHLFLKFSEQILHNIKQEYKRMQKRRHLESNSQQTEGCCPLDSLPHNSLLSGSTLPGTLAFQAQHNAKTCQLLRKANRLTPYKAWFPCAVFLV